MALSTIQNNSFADTAVHGFRNLLVNSAFNIWQRGTSFSAPAHGTYTADRFAIAQTSSFLNVSRDTDTPDGFSYSLKTTVNSATSSPAAGDLARIYYTIEAQDVTQLSYGSSAAKTTSLSFWVKSTVAADYTVFVYVDDPSRSIAKGYTINSANTWEYKTITIAGDTGGSGINNDNGAGITLEFNLVAGSNYNTAGYQDTWTNGQGVRASGQTANCAASGATWQITGVQLEVSSEATPFEHRPYADELQRCLRYYYQLGPYTNQYEVIFMPTWATSTTTQQLAFNFPVKMRAAPTITHNGVSEFRVNDNLQHDEVCNSLLFSQIRPERSMATFGKASANLNVGYSGYINTNNYTSATIYIDAEL